MTSPDFSSARWHKSNNSGDAGCVEVAEIPGWVGVRDSKQPGTSPVLVFGEDRWKEFLAAVKVGDFD